MGVLVDEKQVPKWKVIIPTIIVALLLPATPYALARGHSEYFIVHEHYNMDSEFLEFIVNKHMNTDNLTDALQTAYALAVSRKYVPDPGDEDIIKRPSVTYYLGGDCEDKAVLLASLIKKWAELHNKDLKVGLMLMNIKYGDGREEGHAVVVVWEGTIVPRKMAVLDPTLYFSEKLTSPGKAISNYSKYLEKYYNAKITKSGVFSFPVFRATFFPTLIAVIYR
ncbi:hypothetical protein [Pyrococcus kukulkanii]|uniref:hypothetical protein n=1 Tax=Pyrococcus kukulkanii TaxID=1609559 RepID=UPI00356AC582